MKYLVQKYKVSMCTVQNNISVEWTKISPQSNVVVTGTFYIRCTIIIYVLGQASVTMLQGE